MGPNDAYKGLTQSLVLTSCMYGDSDRKRMQTTKILKQMKEILSPSILLAPYWETNILMRHNY